MPAFKLAVRVTESPAQNVVAPLVAMLKAGPTFIVKLSVTILSQPAAFTSIMVSVVLLAVYSLLPFAAQM